MIEVHHPQRIGIRLTVKRRRMHERAARGQDVARTAGRWMDRQLRRAGWAGTETRPRHLAIDEWSSDYFVRNLEVIEITAWVLLPAAAERRPEA